MLPAKSQAHPVQRNMPELPPCCSAAVWTTPPRPSVSQLLRDSAVKSTCSGSQVEPAPCHQQMQMCRRTRKTVACLASSSHVTSSRNSRPVSPGERQHTLPSTVTVTSPRQRLCSAQSLTYLVGPYRVQPGQCYLRLGHLSKPRMSYFLTIMPSRRYALMLRPGIGI